MYSLNNQLDKTVSLLADVEGNEASPQAFWNLKGSSAYRHQQCKDATAFFDRWLSFYPQDKNAVLGKLLIVDSQKQFDQGLTLTNKVLAKRPDAQLTFIESILSQPTWAG